MSGVGGVVTSKQFITTVAGLLVSILIGIAPGLQEVQTELIASITALTLVLVGAFTVGEVKAAELTARHAENQTAQMWAQAELNKHSAQVASYDSYATPSPRASRPPQLDALLALDELLSRPEVSDFAALKAAAREHVVNLTRYMG